MKGFSKSNRPRNFSSVSNFRKTGVLILPDIIHFTKEHLLRNSYEKLKNADSYEQTILLLQYYYAKYFKAASLSRFEPVFSKLTSPEVFVKNLSSKIENIIKTDSRIKKMNLNSDISFYYDSCLGSVHFRTQVMRKVLEDKIDHLIILPLKLTYGCSAVPKMMTELVNCLNSSEKKTDMKLSFMEPLGNRPDFLKIYSKYIKSLYSFIKPEYQNKIVFMFVCNAPKNKDVRFGDITYLKYYSIANSIMKETGISNKHMMSWFDAMNDEDIYLTPNCMNVLENLIEKYQETNFYFILLDQFFDDYTVKSQFDYYVNHHTKKKYPQCILNRLKCLNDNDSFAKGISDSIVDHLLYNTFKYPNHIMHIDPDCFSRVCSTTRNSLKPYLCS